MPTFNTAIACVTLLLSAVPGQAAGPPTRAEWADTFVVQSEELQGWVDVDYRFTYTDPAWQAGRGPRVCVDEWHFNRHTIRGIYWPFAELLRGDGYRVQPFRSLFTSQALADCEILVIANPQAEGNRFGPGAPESNWAYPHASALTAEEVTEIVSCIRRGGWLQGATRQLDQGRVALLGDGNMCSAGLDDLDEELPGPLVPFGFNDPRAPHNTQFCLNIMHWLSGLLDEATPRP